MNMSLSEWAEQEKNKHDVTALSRIHVFHVALVPKGANGKRFFLMKSKGGDTMDAKLVELLKSKGIEIAITDPPAKGDEAVEPGDAIVVSKSDFTALLDALTKPLVEEMAKVKKSVVDGQEALTKSLAEGLAAGLAAVEKKLTPEPTAVVAKSDVTALVERLTKLENRAAQSTVADQSKTQKAEAKPELWKGTIPMDIKPVL